VSCQTPGFDSFGVDAPGRALDPEATEGMKVHGSGPLGLREQLTPPTSPGSRGSGIEPTLLAPSSFQVEQEVLARHVAEPLRA